ncbi:MAG: hypothetical protein GWN84_07350, partial [Gammaproteobacteria bacterium]|nr:hypothetical protein [Gammaproteobacteria bacterium]
SKDGDLIAFGGIYTDISPQVKAEAQAARLKARYEDVIRSVSDWVWETDGNLNLTHASLRIAETIGTPPQLLKGRYLLSLGEFEDDPRATRSTAKIIEARAPFRN